jgi:hypothetical protein
MAVAPYNLEDLIQSGKQADVLVNVEEEGISKEERDRRSESARIAFEGGKSSLANSDEYRLLRQAGWDWRIATFIAWKASPKRDRVPSTQDELAIQVLGLTSDRVITQWRQKYPEIDDVVATLQAAPLWEHRRDVINALVKSASNSDHRSNPDRKLYLEMTGDYTPKQTVTVKGGIGDDGDMSGFSEKDLIKKSKQVKKDSSAE